MLSSLSSVLVGGMVLLLIMTSYAQFFLMLRSEITTIHELQRVNHWSRQHSVVINGLLIENSTARLSVMFTGEDFSIRELVRSDVFVSCMDMNNNSRVYLTKYEEEWRIIDVSLNGGPELLNPSSIEKMTGRVDDGETVKIDVRIPEFCVHSRQISLIYVSPLGEVGVISSHA